MRYLRCGQHPAPAVWHKARGVSERFIFDLATYLRCSPGWASFSPLTSFSGARRSSSARRTNRTPGTPTSRARCLTHVGVSAWIGLENVSRRSAIRLAAGSHRFGRPIQQAAYDRGLRRDNLSEDVVLMLAREHDATAEVIEPDMTEGDAIPSMVACGTARATRRTTPGRRCCCSSPTPKRRSGSRTSRNSSGHSGFRHARAHPVSASLARRFAMSTPWSQTSPRRRAWANSARCFESWRAAGTGPDARMATASAVPVRRRGGRDGMSCIRPEPRLLAASPARPPGGKATPRAGRRGGARHPFRSG